MTVGGAADESVRDPKTGLPIVLCPVDKSKKGGWTTEGGENFKKYFGTDDGCRTPVILYMGPILRMKNIESKKKMKKYKRILVVSRTHVIVAYPKVEGIVALLKKEADFTRCIPIQHIAKMIYRGNESPPLLALKMKPDTEHDLVFTVHSGENEPDNRTAEFKNIIKVIRACGAAEDPKAPIIPISDSLEPLNLDKPKGWKLVVENPIPKVPWRDILKESWYDANERRREEIAKNLQEREKVPTPSLRATEVEGEAQHSHATLPEIGLPPIPDNPLEPAHEVAAQAIAPVEPMDLRREIDALRDRSKALDRQQRLHMATLGASNRVVSLLQTTPGVGFGPDDDSGGAGGYPGEHSEEDSATAAPHSRNGGGGGGGGNGAYDGGGYDPSFEPDDYGRGLPPTPTHRPPPLPPTPREHPLPKLPSLVRPPPPPPPLQHPPPEAAGAGADEALQAESSAVERLADELTSLRNNMGEELQDKDMQIEVLRAALLGVMEEGEEEDVDALYGSEPASQGRVRGGGGGFDDEYAYEDEEESEEDEEDDWSTDAEDDDDVDVVSLKFRDVDGGRGTDDANSAAGEEGQLVANSHAQSIQTRRREVEELMAQLQDLEVQGRGEDAPLIAELRTQLKRVISDLEIEALSYHDSFATGLPLTQHLEGCPPHAGGGPAGGHLAGLEGGLANLPPWQERSTPAAAGNYHSQPPPSSLPHQQHPHATPMQGQTQQAQTPQYLQSQVQSAAPVLQGAFSMGGHAHPQASMAASPMPGWNAAMPAGAAAAQPGQPGASSSEAYMQWVCAWTRARTHTHTHTHTVSVLPVPCAVLSAGVCQLLQRARTGQRSSRGAATASNAEGPSLWVCRRTRTTLLHHSPQPHTKNTARLRRSTAVPPQSLRSKTTRNGSPGHATQGAAVRPEY